MRTWIIPGLLGAGCKPSVPEWRPAFREGWHVRQTGKPHRVFVGPNCGQACDDVTSMLLARGVHYEVVDVSSPEASEYGVHQYPLTM